MTGNTADRQPCVAVMSSSQALSSFIAENVTQAGFLPIPVCTAALQFPSLQAEPCFIFVDFAADISIVNISRCFPSAGIAVIAGIRDLPHLEALSDIYPYFRFVEKPCSASDIKEALPLVSL